MVDTESIDFKLLNQLTEKHKVESNEIIWSIYE